MPSGFMSSSDLNMGDMVHRKSDQEMREAMAKSSVPSSTGILHQSQNHPIKLQPQANLSKSTKDATPDSALQSQEEQKQSMMPSVSSFGSRIERESLMGFDRKRLD